MLSHVKKERKAQIEKITREVFLSLKPYRFRLGKAYFFAKIFVPYLTTAYGQPEKSLISYYILRYLSIDYLLETEGVFREFIFSAMRVFHKPFISDFPQTSGQAAAGYHAAASRTLRKAQQHGQLRHHADTPHRKQLQTQADGRPAGPPSYRPVHPRCRPGQGPGCR